MIPGTFDLDLYQGDSHAWEFRLWDDEAKTIPTDLTDISPLAQVRMSRGGRLILTMTTTVDVSTPGISKILGSITAADWAAVEVCSPAQTAWWDLQLRHTIDGTVQTVLQGRAYITADVSEVVV